ncbi:MAG: hypothetical protein QNJ55_16800 [Xenococcus sp. MO_188.B8]|nr:hypothetical protein [Xenococcus sp. MO_188.B8]
MTRVEATEETLKTGTIGIIKGTTNEQELRQVYSNDQIDDSFERRSHRYTAVKRRCLR